MKHRPWRQRGIAFGLSLLLMSQTCLPVLAQSVEQTVTAAVARLRQDPDVAYAEPDYELRALLGPSQTITWTLNESYDYYEVQAQETWQLARDILQWRGGAGGPVDPTPVTVAVIDGGVDGTHEDLAGRVLAGVSVLDGVPDADATVDDSIYGQGTVLAGLIAATSGNGIGILGATGGFPVSILPVKALTSDGVGSVSAVAHGIRLAADRGARVINLSLGARLPEAPEALAEAVAYARERGAVVVAAAGEDGGTVAGFYPAATPGVVSVGLLPTWGSPNPAPNSGAAMEAYGYGLTSTLPGNQYGYLQGDSNPAPASSALSAAFVSAAAALIFSVLPDLTAAEVTQALLAGKRPGRPVCYTPDDESYACDSFSLFQSLFMATNPPRVETKRVSVDSTGDEAIGGGSEAPAISGDGRYVAFESNATNLVAGDTNGKKDVFVHDRVTGQTVRVSVYDDGAEANQRSSSPAISGDGRFVAFQSDAGNLVADDTNVCQGVVSCTDIFVFDRLTGAVERVSVDNLGQQGNNFSFEPAISADGRHVAFKSMASNLVENDTNGSAGVWYGQDIFVHDRETHATVRVSVASNGAEGNNSSYRPAISADGRYVAFESRASNLVADDTNGGDDIFVHDRETGTTELVSISGGVGSAGNYPYSYSPSISADGRYVAFESEAADLVPGDINNTTDVFVRDRQAGRTVRVSVSTVGVQGNSYSSSPVISADGGTVAFQSDAENLVTDDTNEEEDIFVTQLAPPDRTAPAWPDRSLTARDVGPDRLTLTWLPAQDDRGVTAYRGTNPETGMPSRSPGSSGGCCSRPGRRRR